MPSMVPRGWILIAVMIHWLLLYCHQQVDSDICASDWKVSDKTGSINIQKMLKHRETQTYTGTLNAQSKHLPYVWSYRSISMTFVLQICGADWGLMVDYTWYQNCFLCRCLLMWKYSGSGFFFPDLHDSFMSRIISSLTWHNYAYETFFSKPAV